MAAELNREVEDWRMLGARQRRRTGGIWKRRSGEQGEKGTGSRKNIIGRKNYKKRVNKYYHKLTVVCSFCDIGAFWSNVSVVNSW